jgi:hypothetical protein
MGLRHREDIEHVEFGHKGYAGILPLVEEQQSSPIRVPTFRKSQDIGSLPLLPLNVIVVAIEEMARRIARSLGIGEGDGWLAGDETQEPKNLFTRHESGEGIEQGRRSGTLPLVVGNADALEPVLEAVPCLRIHQCFHCLSLLLIQGCLARTIYLEDAITSVQNEAPIGAAPQMI